MLEKACEKLKTKKKEIKEIFWRIGLNNFSKNTAFSDN